MFRIVRLGRKWFATEIEDLENDLENITEFVDTEGLVILADDVEQAQTLLYEEIEVV